MARKILIIDDEPDILEILRLRLEAGQYGVLTANNGMEGLKVLKSERPDLVILDVMMPQMDGFSFIQEIKKDESLKGTPVIVLTAKELMDKIFKMEGIRDYILKPFQGDQVLAAVRKHLKN